MNLKRVWEYIFIGSCLLILFFLLLGSIMHESPTYDEVTYVKAGYQFLINKDFRFDPFSPPLAKEIIALPSLINKNVIYDKTIFWPRLVVVIFSMGLAVLVYAFSKNLFGDLSAKLALTLYIFEPTLLAHGHYATADLIFTFFYILSLFCFWIWRDKFNYRNTIIFGIIIGLLLSTKITSIPFLLFPLLVLYVLSLKNKRNLVENTFWKKKIWKSLLFFLVIIIALWATYFFKFEPALGYRFDKNRPAIELAKNNLFIRMALTTPVPLGSYISTLKQMVIFNYSGLYVKMSYFPGMVSFYGSPGYYFPIIFLLKTQLPLLILFFLSLIFFFRDIKQNGYIAIPLLIIFLDVLISNVALVIRYILPVFPLVIIYSSQIVKTRIVNKVILRTFLVIILIWYMSGAIRAYPHFVSYANEASGGPKNIYKLIVDSNYDWGQGLIALKDYQEKNNITNLQLAYFGSINPSKYGIKYEKIKNLAINDSKKTVKLKFDENHTIAISATCWYFCGYYKSQDFKDASPKDIVGGSILIFRK